MTGLAPATTVYYATGNPVDGWSDVRSFTSRRAPETREVKFLMYKGRAEAVSTGPGFAASFKRTTLAVQRRRKNHRKRSSSLRVWSRRYADMALPIAPFGPA